MNTPDIIGTIYKPTGKLITEGGFEYEEQAPIAGYHVNFISEVPVSYLFASRSEWELEWEKIN